MTIEKRRYRGDRTEPFKLLNDKENIDALKFFTVLFTISKPSFYDEDRSKSS